MARIPEAEIERIKTETNLVGLIESRGIELKGQGENLVGRCPFHDDRTPSLVVTPSKNLWHCMGACQVGGSVIDWVMKIEGVSFRHAVMLLNEKNGLIEKSGTKAQNVPKLAQPVDFLADDEELLKQVAEYYHETLKNSPEALSYLEARGLRNDEAIEKFKLGFSNRTLGLRIPQSRTIEGASLRDRLEKLGVYRESGHEFLNGSLVVPVIGSDGKVTEMYGRKITTGLRPGTPLHCYLPGPHRGVWNVECLESEEVILCEALLDALTFWVHGFRNVTASYGVEGFTKDHFTAFRESGVKRVLIAYDRDEAGDKAAEKLAAKLLPEGIECSRVQFPKGMDANEYALKMQPAAQALRVCVEAASPMGVANAEKAQLRGKPAAKEKKEETFSSTATAVTSSAEIPTLPQACEPTSSSLAAASPLPEKPSEADPVEVATEIRGEDILIRLAEREYRVRGLKKNPSYETLRVNVRVRSGSGSYVDTLDLYQAKSRSAYTHGASTELGIASEMLKRDLGKVLFKLEEIQDEEKKKQAETPSSTQAREVLGEDREQALRLLKSPDLIGRILSDFEACGVTGEETNKLVGYLAAVSRKLDQPLAVIVQSSSAAGKSSLMEAVLAMMPTEDKTQYSAMTGQSLFYLGETNLKNKILAIAEEEGVSRAAYALKLLQSEGEISIASTGKDPVSGRMVTHQYRVEGPVMIFLTTTAIEIDEELLNRCLVLTVNESREQTRAIHELQRRAQNFEGLLSRESRSQVLKLHQNAQRLLRPMRVVNPFAEKLTFLDSRTRTRRDHVKYLSLIRTIALLHQYQREIKRTEHRGEMLEYIEVNEKDIETANRLCHQVLGRSIDELAPQTRRLLSLIAEFVAKACEKERKKQEDLRFTRKEIREFTGWSDFQVQTHLNKLAELEYVLVHRGGRGQSFVYELLFDGSGGVDGPRLPGLVDATCLKSGAGVEPSADNVEYDGKLPQSFEHLTQRFEHPNSPEIAPKWVGCRSFENGQQSESSDKNDENHEKTHIRGVSKYDCSSYLTSAEDSSEGDLPS